MENIKKQELILTVGLPGSGKTTWAEKFVNDNRNFINLNRDDIRRMFYGSHNRKFCSTNEQIVRGTLRASVISAITSGKSVVISDTNMAPKSNQFWKDFAKSNDLDYREQLFTDVPHGVCIERDSNRERTVGSKVIMDMYNRHNKHWNPTIKYSEDLEDCYIVDIDGTLAKMHDRGPYDWKKVSSDLPIIDVIDVINVLSENSKIIIMSGRDGSCLEETTQWLEDNSIVFDEIHMRGANDRRKDYVVKRELFDKNIRGKFNVKGVFDDRDQVVHLWRHLGFTVFQVNYGGF